MAQRAATHLVLSAQFLGTGAPAYLTASGAWSGELQRAALFATDAGQGPLLEQAALQERVVCDPYLFEVRVRNEMIDPLSARERIRAQGPSTRIRRPDAGEATP
jgi:hypothetical protein